MNLFRQHTAAYVSIRQHTPLVVDKCWQRNKEPVLGSLSLLLTCCLRARWQVSKADFVGGFVDGLPFVTAQHTSAYVSIRQHTSA
jgi:hypothetical protein